jgi:hypothetical protein
VKRYIIKLPSFVTAMKKLSLSKAPLDNKIVSIIFCIVTAFVITDVIINGLSDLIVNQITSSSSVIFFIILICLCNFGMYYFVFSFITKKSKEIRSKDQSLQVVHRLIQVVQFSMVGVMVAVVLEIIFTSKYHTILVIAVSGISQISIVGILGFFSLKFLSWFKVNKSSVIVLLYGSSFALISLSYAAVVPFELSLLMDKSPIRTAQSEVIFPSNFLASDSSLNILLDVYEYSDLIAFSLLIPATAILLYHYSQRVGRVKFWTLVLLPLVYYLVVNFETYGIEYEPQSDLETFYYFLLISLNSTAGGILFGIAFWTIGKTLRQESSVRQYMIIASYGFTLFFIATQSYLVAASYPPYGLVTSSFLPMSSYMIFLGLCSTAISISQDNQLRKSIKKLATENSNLLSSIGTAQMEQEIRKTVNSMKGIVQEQEKKLQEQSGIEANLEEDEMKNYLEEVMQEVGTSRKPSA